MPVAKLHLMISAPWMSQNAKVHPFLLPASKAEQPLRRALTSLQLARRIGSNVQSLNAAPEKSAPRMVAAWKGSARSGPP